MNSSLELGRIMGIPVRLHWTFIFIILFVAWDFSTFHQSAGGSIYGFGLIEPAWMRWLFSLLFALLLFACVALHEIGHSYVAKRRGVVIRSITLYFFGGVALMEEIPRNPRLELQMAFTGPLVSGALGLAFLFIGNEARALMGLEHPISILLGSLGTMNIMLMAFNLLPAFPMDGGRLLRAWFAFHMPYVRATRRASDIGKIFATLMFLLGLGSLNLMLLFVAFFVYVGASEEEKATEITVSLEGIRVRDIMTSEVQSVSPQMMLDELKELMFRQKHRGYPVFLNGELLGMVTVGDIEKVAEEKRATTSVEMVMARKLYLIAPSEEASRAMKMMNELQIRRLLVMDGGRMVGIISREDLVRAIELCSKL